MIEVIKATPGKGAQTRSAQDSFIKASDIGTFQRWARLVEIMGVEQFTYTLTGSKLKPIFQIFYKFIISIFLAGEKVYLFTIRNKIAIVP